MPKRGQEDDDQCRACQALWFLSCVDSLLMKSRDLMWEVVRLGKGRRKLESTWRTFSPRGEAIEAAL